MTLTKIWIIDSSEARLTAELKTLLTRVNLIASSSGPKRRRGNPWSPASRLGIRKMNSYLKIMMIESRNPSHIILMIGS